MMSYSHVEQLDRAVRVACEGARGGQGVKREELTRYLYERWYLASGVGSLESRVPTITGQTWQGWSPRWTSETGRLGAQLVRLYLACAPDTAVRVAGIVTTVAASWTEPWRFTSSAVSSSNPRPHETVLYVPISSLPQLRREIEYLLGRLRPLMRPETPAFTLKVGRGAALAQNPGDGRDFGEHRCSLVAGSVLANLGCHHREHVDRAAREFAAAGIDPERPYRERQAVNWDNPWRQY